MGLFQTIAHLFRPRRSNNHRPRILHPEVLLILALISSILATVIYGWSNIPGKTGFILGYASSITPSQVIELTNAERAKSGLAPLTLNSVLSNAASSKGKHMFANQYWAHTAPDGTQPWAFIRNAGYSYSIAGENLARDFAETNSMVAAWMASPTHRANIMNSRYSDIGIAVIDGTLDGFETTLVVQMFGSPKENEPSVAADDAPAVTSISQIAPNPVVEEVLEPEPETTEESGLALDSLVIDDESATSPATLIRVAQADPRPSPRNEVLASFLVPQGEVLVPPLFTPLQLMKALFLSITMILIMTLSYDAFVIGNRYTLRLVGKNMAHIAFWFTVAFLIIFFKGGIIG